MKKNNQYKDLSFTDLQAKKKEFVKDLLTSRLSMDASSLSTASNIQQLMRELKAVNRALAKAQNAEMTQQEIG